jgi:uncharacterized protein (DUF169 family)
VNPNPISSHAETARTLEDSLQLSLAPVAVSFRDTVPEGVAMFQGKVPAGCVFWEKAAREGFATSAADHDLCSIGVYTHNLKDPSPNYESELQTVMQVLGELEYVRPADMSHIPFLERRAKYVVYAPLAGVSFDPDVVVVFADARRSLILAEAAQQVEMGIPPAMGRPACSAIPQAVNSGRAAMSLGCCGARAYLNALSDDVAIWALPGSKASQYAERVRVLAKANALLGRFHQLRREDVEAGAAPTYAESMSRLQAE